MLQTLNILFTSCFQLFNIVVGQCLISENIKISVWMFFERIMIFFTRLNFLFRFFFVANINIRDRWTRTLVSAEMLVRLCQRTRKSQILKPQTWTRTRTAQNFESRTRTRLFQIVADTRVHRSMAASDNL